MLDIKTLLPDLKKRVTDLSEDLLARSTAKNDPYSAKVEAGLREAYTQIEKGGRTAAAFEVWREDYLEQVAVAWVLGCVFVRFMEDNHLIDECWLAGDSDRRKLAEDTHELYFRAHPHESDREYFEHVFREVGKIPACRDLFAEGKTPLWAVGPSGDMAMKLLAFWRDVVPETGELRRTFEVKDGDTRFLGDLYQDLSESAQKKYALKQTPVFVEEFILDRTLNPAIDEFGLDEVRMIDPTCGSGHFLLGGFARLFGLWMKREDNEVVAARKALDGVWGVDINPFAVAIARFRLIVAALRACGIKQLKNSPAWSIHLATGDSLLFGSRWDREGKKKGEQQFLGTEEESWAPEIYACEDKDAITEVLGQQYHAVVGNPPYITPKDRSLSNAYRSRYLSCHRQYSLGVPFTERFFDLALASDLSAHTGFVGLITTNSFMKREFGTKLIDTFFPTIDLTHVVDVTHAHIPGHSTPPVILFGRNREPTTDYVRSVFGLRGESGTPTTPSEGLVWQSILHLIDREGEENEYITVNDEVRGRFHSHPWTLTSGAEAQIKETLDNHSRKLGALADIGIASWAGIDDVYVCDDATAARKKWEQDIVRAFVSGDLVRDWRINVEDVVAAPYDNAGEVVNANDIPNCVKSWWASRSHLNARVLIGGSTFAEEGLPFYGWVRWIKKRCQPSTRITFAFIASHNHFALDRGENVFNRSAPTIQLSGSASEDDYLSLLGVLNSSTACYWMKQVFYPKASGVGDISSEKGKPEANRYEFAVTGMQSFPLPAPEVIAQSRVGTIVRKIDHLVTQLGQHSPEMVLITWVNTGCKVGGLNGMFEECEVVEKAAMRRLVALQEELDWEVYRLYGLTPVGASEEITDDDKCGVSADLRPFMRANREVAPLQVPVVSEVYSKRLTSIKENRFLRVLEKPVFKRLWRGRQGVYGQASRTFGESCSEVCRNWLLGWLESVFSSFIDEPLVLQSINTLGDRATADRQFLEVASIVRGRSDFDVAGLIAELVERESCPLLPRLLFNSSGIQKRLLWEQCWAEQRKQDTHTSSNHMFPPPKYQQGDFSSANYWRLRGKFDILKERWISFPHCETESDPSLVVGWAGWNHLQQASAIIAYYDARKREGWDAKRLTPLLAGLDQLLPWIHQWHPEVDPEFGETAGQSFETMLKADAHELGLTLEDIRAWEPPAKTTTRRKRKTT